MAAATPTTAPVADDTQIKRLATLFEPLLARYAKDTRNHLDERFGSIELLITDLMAKICILEGTIAGAKKAVPKSGTTPKQTPLNAEQIGAAVASGQIVAPPPGSTTKLPSNARIFFNQMFSRDATFRTTYLTEPLKAHMALSADIAAKSGSQKVTAENSCAWVWYKENEKATFDSFAAMYGELKVRAAAGNKPAQQEPDEKSP